MPDPTTQEAPLSRQAMYNPRPTLRIDGQENDLVRDLLLSLVMTESEGGLSALELRFGNIASGPQGSAGFAFEDNRVLKLGAQISAYAGDAVSPREIFQGVITGLEADFSKGEPPELVVLAEDAFQKARMARRTRLFDSTTIADLARDLAGQLRLTPVITGFSDDIGLQVQFNESDLAFFRRLLRRYDGDAQVVGQELHVSARKDVQRGTLYLALHSQLTQARFLADLAHQVTGASLTGWDATQGQRITASRGSPDLGPGSGTDGATLLQQALGARVQHVAHLAARDNAEAQALIDVAFAERARRFVVVEGTAEGNSSLRVGTHVHLSGVGSRFENTYYVVKAVHRYDVRSGYETDFVAECAYLGV
jgi:uncharacterized protein